MAERFAGYISALPGCLGWGQDPDREKIRDGFGFFGSRYQNTANGTRDEQNGRADTIQNEETNPRNEYRDEGENPGGAENSVGDDEISVHEMDLESSDDGKEPQIRLPYLFPVLYPSPGPDQLDEAENREGDCTTRTPPASENAGPSNSTTCCRSAPPDQINILCDIFDNASFKANTAPQKRSKDFIVSRRPGPVKGCSSFMASPNSLDPKHNTTEERRNTGKILGSVASTRHAWRPTVSSGLKRWGSSPHGSGNLHSACPRVPPTSQRSRGKSETNRGSTSSHVSSVGQYNPRLSHLPARYRARKAGNVLVDKVVAEEMVEWAREDQEEAEARKRNKEAKDQEPAEAKKRNKEAKPRQP